VIQSIQKKLLWAGNLLVGGTGLLLLWVKTFYSPPLPVDEFDLSGLVHPWQSLAQHSHIWSAPILVLAIGMVWHAHAWMYWRDGVRSGKTTGLILLAMAAPMIFSGYAISTTITDQARNLWIWIHLISSAIWLLSFLAHSWRHWRQKRS